MLMDFMMIDSCKNDQMYLKTEEGKRGFAIEILNTIKMLQIQHALFYYSGL